VINDFEIINEPHGSWAFLGTPVSSPTRVQGSITG
jgi:hypothetical protein